MLASRHREARKTGHKVYALTLTGLAERSHLLSRDINLDTHITDIANLVEWEDLTDIASLPIRMPDVPHRARLSALETVCHLSSGLMQ